MKSKFYFVDGTAIHIGAQIPDISEYVYIRQRLTGIEKNSIGIFKCILKFTELIFDFLRMVNVQWGPIFFRHLNKVAVGKSCRHICEYKPNTSMEDWKY